MNPEDLDRIVSLGLGCFFFFSGTAPGKLKKAQEGEMVVPLTTCSNKHLMNFFVCHYSAHQIRAGFSRTSLCSHGKYEPEYYCSKVCFYLSIFTASTPTLG